MARKSKENMPLEMAQLKEKYGDEVVRVVPAVIVKPVLRSVWTPADKALFTVMSPDKSVLKTPLLHTININMEDMPRYKAELDPSYKQVIGYCVIRRGNQIFVTHRLDKSGEARLMGMYSCGTGGHATVGERVAVSIARELEEEVGVKDDMIVGKILKGYILDESTAVNSVHLGLVYEVVVNTKDIACREKGKLEGEWMDISAFLDLYRDDKLESWSRIVAENMFGGAAQ